MFEETQSSWLHSTLTDFLKFILIVERSINFDDFNSGILLRTDCSWVHILIALQFIGCEMLVF